MRKYRIVKRKSGNDTHYVIQERFLYFFFWTDDVDPHYGFYLSYKTLKAAEKEIERRMNKNPDIVVKTF